MKKTRHPPSSSQRVSTARATSSGSAAILGALDLWLRCLLRALDLSEVAVPFARAGAQCTCTSPSRASASALPGEVRMQWPALAASQSCTDRRTCWLLVQSEIQYPISSFRAPRMRSVPFLHTACSSSCCVQSYIGRAKTRSHSLCKTQARCTYALKSQKLEARARSLLLACKSYTEFCGQKAELARSVFIHEMNTARLIGVDQQCVHRASLLRRRTGLSIDLQLTSV
jgi:hypothetical protein